MEIAAIIQLIIMILTIISQLIGGTTFQGMLTDDQTVVENSGQYWSCGEAQWPVANHYNGRELNGTISVRCNVVGNKGDGLQGLKDHLKQSVKASAAEVVQLSEPTFSDANYFSASTMRLVTQADNETETFNGVGTLKIVNDTELSHTFEPSAVAVSDKLKWLKGFKQEMKVKATNGRWYQVDISVSSTIERPLLISGKKFQELVEEQFAKKLKEKAHKIANNLSGIL